MAYVANINTGEVKKVTSREAEHLFNQKKDGVRIWFYTHKRMYQRWLDFERGVFDYPPLFIQKNIKTGRTELVNIIRRG